MKRLTTWDLTDVKNAIKIRFEKEIQEWEKDKKVIHNIYKNALENAKEQYDIVIKNITEIRMKGHGDVQAVLEAAQRLFDSVTRKLQMPDVGLATTLSPWLLTGIAGLGGLASWVSGQALLAGAGAGTVVLTDILAAILAGGGLGRNALTLVAFGLFGAGKTLSNMQTKHAIMSRMFETDLLNQALKPLEENLINALKEISEMIKEELQAHKNMLQRQSSQKFEEKLDVVEQYSRTQADLLSQSQLLYMTYFKDYIPRTEITVIKKIGEGSFGDVYEGKWKEQTVALKIMEAQLSASNVAEIQREEIHPR